MIKDNGTWKTIPKNEYKAICKRIQYLFQRNLPCYSPPIAMMENVEVPTPVTWSSGPILWLGPELQVTTPGEGWALLELTDTYTADSREMCEVVLDTRRLDRDMKTWGLRNKWRWRKKSNCVGRSNNKRKKCRKRGWERSWCWQRRKIQMEKEAKAMRNLGTS
jgi:hypothetical protein